MGLTNYSLNGPKPPEPPKPPSDAPPSEGGASSLDKLVEGIYNSVMFAQRKVETEHLKRIMSTYFDQHGNAKTFKVNLPCNNGEVNTADIPLITLSNNSHLVIDELEMEFSVNLGHFGDEINQENNKLSALLTGPATENKTSVKIKMKGANPPEGIAKVNDQLLKIFPN